MRRGLKVFCSAVALFVLCACARVRASASVFRERAAFEAASQNLHTLDFENQKTGDLPNISEIDGVRFENFFGPTSIHKDSSLANAVLDAGGVGEITTLTIYLPPGTTAVGCEQFSRPMNAQTSTGESVSMSQSDGSNFVGFVSDAPVVWLRLTLDFPEPTPNVLMDNLSFGQRRAGNEPAVPLLLVTNDTGRAAALDSVTLMPEPFNVANANNLSADGRTRVTLYLTGVSLEAADASTVTARASDSQGRVFDLPVEAVGRVKNLSWMSQVTVRLPEGLAGGGETAVTLTVRGAQSNTAVLRVN